MARINVLTGEAPAVPLPVAPAPRKSARKPKARPAVAPRGLLSVVATLPDSIFAFLTQDAAVDAPRLREQFRKYCTDHPGHPEWRKAWDAFWQLHRQPPPPQGTGETVAFQPALTPFLTRSFPKALHRLLGARGDLIAFESSLRGGVEFSRRYELRGYMPLCVEVLPPLMCPAGVPAVSVSHTFEQNGDLMRDPEIVFAVVQMEAWLPYEITQDPVGVFRCAYQQDQFFPKISKDISGLVGTWARNLSAQGWGDPVRPEIGGNVGAILTGALSRSGASLPSGAGDGKTILFPDPVRDLLDEIARGGQMPGKSPPERFTREPAAGPAVFVRISKEWQEMTADERRQHMALGYAPHVNGAVYSQKKGKAREAARQRLARGLYEFLHGYTDAELGQLCIAHVARDFEAGRHTH